MCKIWFTRILVLALVSPSACDREKESPLKPAPVIGSAPTPESEEAKQVKEAPAPPVKERPTRFSISQAWQQAGAQSIRKAAEDGHKCPELTQGGLSLTPGWTISPDDLPAYKIVKWTPGTLAKLPHPTERDDTLPEPFGLYIDCPEWTDDALKELAGFEQLRALQFASATPLSDTSLKILATFPNVRSLSIARCKGITAAGLSELAGLKELHALRFQLAEIALSADEIKSLAGLKTLRILELPGAHLSAKELKEMAPLKHLTYLELGGPKDETLNELRQFTELRVLNIWQGLFLTDDGLKHLTACPQLRELRIHWPYKITDQGTHELAKLKELRVLDLRAQKVTDKGLKTLTACQKLQSLRLGGTAVTDAGMKDLATIKDLRALDLNNTRLSDVGLKELAVLKEMRYLFLGNTRVTFDGLFLIVDMHKLCFLHVRGSLANPPGVTDETLPQKLRPLLDKLPWVTFSPLFRVLPFEID